jgi:hypothetical protein
MITNGDDAILTMQKGIFHREKGIFTNEASLHSQ